MLFRSGHTEGYDAAIGVVKGTEQPDVVGFAPVNSIYGLPPMQEQRRAVNTATAGAMVNEPPCTHTF